ncbi:MAG: MFS transporter [Fuerstiella sp.]
MEQPPNARGKLMFASFLTLVASGVGFATRTAAGPAWEAEFGIGGEQFGQILGAGFLGFGLMIFFGGILVEAFGYKKLLCVAFLLHLASAGMLFMATPDNAFTILFWSAFAFSICQGLYEAVINPMIAQLYPEKQTHYLNILHAGWPAGMIIGGLFAACFMGNSPFITAIPWTFAMSFFVVFVLVYGVLALPQKFPATVGEKSSDFGTLFSCFASLPFLVLLVLHGLIGYMELGVDSWMTKLMENLLPNAVLVLVYTSALMFILRFFAGPIVHRVNPIGLLFGSSVIAALGLVWLSQPIDSLVLIFVAATFYSLGKAFLWPTMLGVAGERYPQSGSIAMGALGAVGMITVGQIAGSRIGTQQGYHMAESLETNAPATYERYSGDGQSAWGYEYNRIAPPRLGLANKIGEEKEVEKVEAIFATAEVTDKDPSAEDFSDGDLTEATRTDLQENWEEDVPKVIAANLSGSRSALYDTAVIPAAMAVGFLGLLVYFASIGGYKVIRLDGSKEEDVNPENADEKSESTPA